MRGRAKVKRSPEEIAQELADGCRQPFEAHGKSWQGDIFYSDIHMRTKGQPYSVYQNVCVLLRHQGFYIHS